MDKLIELLRKIAALPVVAPFIALLHSRAFLSAAAVVIGGYISLLDPRLAPYAPQIIAVIGLVLFLFFGKMTVEEAARIITSPQESYDEAQTDIEAQIKEAVDEAVKIALGLDKPAPTDSPAPTA